MIENLFTQIHASVFVQLSKVRIPQIFYEADCFACALHFWSEHRVGAGEASEGKNGLLDGDIAVDAPYLAQRTERLPDHDPRGHLCHRRPDRLCDEGHRAAGAWVHFEDIEPRPVDDVLDIHRPRAPIARAIRVV